MKIAIIADYFLASMGYPKIQLAKAWQKQGHSVRVLTSDRYFPFHQYHQTVEGLIGPRQRKAGVHVENEITVERKKTRFELFARTYFDGVKSFIDRFKPDVVVVFGVSSGSAAQVAQLKKKYNHSYKLILVDSHLPSELMLGNQTLKRIFYGTFRKLFSKLLVEQGDKFIATQDKTVDIIKQLYGITAPVTLIPNGTDTTVFKKDVASRKLIRQEYNIPSKGVVIIYTGKVIPEKGVGLLFKAFNILASRCNDLYLLIVGNGPTEYLHECFSLVDPQHHSRIVSTGTQPQTDLYRFYSAADMAVWPLQESLAMNDAASCELPFIANHTMGDRTRISNQNALLYKKNDAADLAKKIKQLYEDRELRLLMGKRGRQLVEQRLSWKMLAQRYLE